MHAVSVTEQEYGNATITIEHQQLNIIPATDEEHSKSDSVENNTLVISLPESDIASKLNGMDLSNTFNISYRK